ncbi:MAG: type II toxin-antitoxin system HicA family toxin [Isosphaeraceae bacterium]
MKRRRLEQHLRVHDCEFMRHGARHDLWLNPSNQQTVTIPRHSEIKLPIVRSICRQLGVPEPPGR